jgi:hypothetical protein
MKYWIDLLIAGKSQQANIHFFSLRIDLNLAPTSYLLPFFIIIYIQHIKFLYVMKSFIIYLHITIYILLYMMEISGELITELSSIFCTGIGAILAYMFKIK